MTDLPVLRTPRLRLDIPGDHAADALLAYCRANEAHLAPWGPTPPPGWWTRELQAERLRVAQEGARVGLGYRFQVHLADDDAIVGGVSLSNLVHGAFSACHLGYGVDVRCEGKGLAFEAVSAVVDFAFTMLGLHRVMANHRPENTRSAALLRRLGFVPEGYARDYLFLDGAWRDHVLTAKVNPTMTRTDPPPAVPVPGVPAAAVGRTTPT